MPSGKTLADKSIRGGASSGGSPASVGLSNTSPLQIGQNAGGGYYDGEIMAAAIFRRALTATEIQTLNTYFQARFP